MPAGDAGDAYYTRFVGFQWHKFYSESAGGQFLEDLRAQLIQRYDYVLIDGAGISDAAGICTIQMPDLLASCFPINEMPRAEGVAALFGAVARQRRDREIRFFPIPTKVDLDGGQKLDAARKEIRTLFTPFTKWSYAEVDQYWRDIEIPYVPFYSYGDILCTFGDASGWPQSMLSSMERICEHLTCGRITKLPPVPEDQRIAICAKFGSAPNQIRTCFISYSNEDKAFAERLKRDLEEAGFECWFAPDKLSVGANIRPQIDEAIRRHAKVVLILSQHSIDSPWVEDEAESTFENEKAARGPLLFPLRIDSSVLNTQVSWAAKIRRQRNIGDFSCWGDEDKYMAALQRLITDLR
jgi:hypothetical protein